LCVLECSELAISGPLIGRLPSTTHESLRSVATYETGRCVLDVVCVDGEL